MIQGMTVRLYNRNLVSFDDFGEPVYAETYEDVDDVLVGSPTEDDELSDLDLNGKQIAYVLGIPKGDTHTWKDQRVEFFGEKFMCVGFPIEGIEANIPLRWHKKVRVVRYE